MSDEINELREVATAIVDYDSVVNPLWIEKLAHAWLAEHPADEGEPADAEWLRSVGFVPHVRDDELALTLDSFQEIAWTLLIVTFNAGSNCPPNWGLLSGVLGEEQQREGISLRVHPTTRGAVRQLCAALGKDLPHV